MPINASAKSTGTRQIAPAGTHIARCYQIIDLGTHDKEWQGKTRKKHEIRISWELSDETADFGKGHPEPFSVHKTYTLSLSEKASLRHDLECWRGRIFTESELESFDVAKVIGAPCMVTIAHVEKSGNTYANVTAVTAMPKGVTAPAQVNPSLEYSIHDHDEQVFQSLPQFMKDIIQSSDEWKEHGSDAGNSSTPSDDIPEDDIPF